MPYKDPTRQKAAQRAHYERNRALYRRRNNESKKAFREWAQTLKQDPCMDCGGKFHHAAMHWDHRPGTEKIAGVAQLLQTLSKQIVLDEIAKCDLVCANCHAVRTWGRDQYFGRTSDTDVKAA